MEFADGVARKIGSPSVLAVELAKTERAAEIGDATGLFYVPRVVSFDRQEGVLEFEHLADLHNLLAMASKRDPRAVDLAGRAGVALAAVHERLVLPEEATFPLPPEWMAPPGQNVFIHGDFTGDNVCYHEPTGRLVIVDWSAAPFMKGVPTFGSPFFDVTWFVMNLCYSRLSRRMARYASLNLADTFLDGYIESSGLDLTRPVWRHCRALALRLHREVLRHAVSVLGGLDLLRYVVRQVSAQIDLRTYCPRRFRRTACKRRGGDAARGSSERGTMVR